MSRKADIPCHVLNALKLIETSRVQQLATSAKPFRLIRRQSGDKIRRDLPGQPADDTTTHSPLRLYIYIFILKLVSHDSKVHEPRRLNVVLDRTVHFLINT